MTHGAAEAAPSSPPAPAVVIPTTSPADAHQMGPLTLVACLIADLSPHGMLPLAFGMAARGGTGARR